MNPSDFTCSSVTEDLENFVEELQTAFEVMHVVDVERVELATYQLKGVARIWYDQWKKKRVEGAPSVSWVVFEGAFMGHFFPRMLREAKEYNLKFTQLSRYAPEMVVSYVKQGSKAAMLIGDMDIPRLMIHVQQVEEDKLTDSEELHSKKAKTTGNESGQTSEIDLHNLKVVWHNECGRTSHFTKEFPKNRQGSGNGGNRAQSSSVAPPDRVVPRGATLGTSGRANRLNAITSHQEQENLPDVVTGMIKVFTFDVYALLDPGASLSFVTPYVAIRFDIIPKQILEPLIVSTPIGKSILVERVYHDCTISVNRKDTMDDLVELDMVDFDVILDDLPGVFPQREIDCGIDILLDTRPISIPPYKIAPTELRELKEQLKDLLDKVRIWLESVAFLGHIIYGNGIRVHTQKIEAVDNWPGPISPTDIRSFLGLAGYYRRFVEGFSLISSTLTKLTQKTSKFQWSEACEKSFQELKTRLTTAPMLTLREDSREKFPTHELELAVVVFALKNGVTISMVFMLICSPITRVFSMYSVRKLNLRHRRWLELLKDYDMSILYHPSKANSVVDALSRLSMGSIAHVEEGKKELARGVHKLARLGVWLMDSNEGGVVVMNGVESSLVSEVKE
ncbi:hypothetical protein KY289_026475 [Solanum tuberosum]|nr:hypothetical protein KY289_026475 [Solanum tuberosum]